MWDLPGPRFEPVSPAGGFLTTAPPGKPSAIVNNAALNIHVQVFTWTYVFISLGYAPRSGIAGSYSNSI